MTTTTPSSPAEDARNLPREPTSRWILVLLAGMTIIWLGVLAWQVAVLPDRVPTHFDSHGQADGWSSKAGALAYLTLLPAFVVFLLPLMALLALYWPQAINLPNRDWWTATGARVRRFERLLREDLWLIGAATLAMFIAIQVGITRAAVSGAESMSGLFLWGPMVVLFVVIGWVMVRMMGGRYAEQSDLA